MQLCEIRMLKTVYLLRLQRAYLWFLFLQKIIFLCFICIFLPYLCFYCCVTALIYHEVMEFEAKERQKTMQQQQQNHKGND